MAAPLNVSMYCTLLIRSKLLSTEEVKAAQQRWENQKKSPGDVEGFYKSLVASKQLTEYQAALINRGHSEGFFLDSYKIVDIISRGRLSGVYKAIHPSGQVVAIKILPASRAKDPATLARFQREARLSVMLDHPNVVRSFQVNDSETKPFFVMEYLEGETLEEVLERRKKLPIAEAARLIYQALQGLQHIHEKGLIHRDMKPSNLMLVSNREGKAQDLTLASTLKILDIGVGRSLFEEDPVKPGPNKPGGNESLTIDGIVLGTPDYLAPEQARNARSVDIRADIYSLGCVFYRCLTGQIPFSGTTSLEVMVRHANETPKLLSEFLSPVSPGLQSLVDRMMAKDPSHRFSTPEQTAQAMLPFVAATNKQAEASQVQPAFEAWLKLDPETQQGKAPAIPMGKRVPSHPKDAKEPKESSGKEFSRSTEPVTLDDPFHFSAANSNPIAPPPPLPTRSAPTRPSELDVELVPVALPKPPKDRDERSLLDWDRRDALMMFFGAAGVSFAVGTGYFLSRLARRRIPENVEDKKEIEKKEPDKKEAEKKESDKKEVDNKEPEKKETEKKEMDKKEVDKKMPDKKELDSQ